MKNLFLVIIVLFTQSFLAVKAEEFHIPKDSSYIKLRKEDYRKLRRQAFITRNVLQRIRDLETLYKSIKAAVEGINKVIKIVEDTLNIDLEIPLLDGGSNTEYEHISGVILDPGFIEVVVKTTDQLLTFDDLGLDSLDFDLYYNKNLFQIDRIEGDTVLGEEFRLISLSTKTSGAKDRIDLPLTDILSGESRFKVYFAPRNPDLIKVGNKSNLDLRYYKRVSKNQDGERIAPLQYDFAENSAKQIKVKVK